MLWPADTDWVRRGNSSVASSFNRPLSRMLLPLSFLQQENRIQQHSDKPQAHLGISLSGIDWSWHFTSEVTSPDLHYDFIACLQFPIRALGRQCPVLPQSKHHPSLIYLAQLLAERVVLTHTTSAFTCVVACQFSSVALQFRLGLYSQCSTPMHSLSREMVSNFRSTSASGRLLIRSCFISHLSPL